MHILTKELKDSEDKTVKSSSEKTQNMDMLKSLLLATPRDLGHHAIASSILFLVSNEQLIADRWTRLASLCGLLKKIVNLFTTTWYDGELMVKYMVQSDHNSNTIGLDVKARIVFECVLLMVPKAIVDQSLESDSNLLNDFSLRLLVMKKRILRWFLNSFELLDAKQIDQFNTRQPQPPMFDSILDGDIEELSLTGNLKILHCLLFLCQPDSMNLLEFLNPNVDWKVEGTPYDLEDARARVLACTDLGRTVDNELLRIILEATKEDGGTTGPVTAIELIECMLYNCRDERKGSICIHELNIVWDLYSLAEYIFERAGDTEDIPR